MYIYCSVYAVRICIYIKKKHFNTHKHTHPPTHAFLTQCHSRKYCLGWVDGSAEFCMLVLTSLAWIYAFFIRMTAPNTLPPL